MIREFHSLLQIKNKRKKNEMFILFVDYNHCSVANENKRNILKKQTEKEIGNTKKQMEILELKSKRKNRKKRRKRDYSSRSATCFTHSYTGSLRMQGPLR